MHFQLAQGGQLTDRLHATLALPELKPGQALQPRERVWHVQHHPFEHVVYCNLSSLLKSPRLDVIVSEASISISRLRCLSRCSWQMTLKCPALIRRMMPGTGWRQSDVVCWASLAMHAPSSSVYKIGGLPAARIVCQSACFAEGQG